MSNVTAVPIPPVQRSYLVWLWLGIAAAILGAAALAWAAPQDAAAVALAKVRRADDAIKATDTGLLYKVLTPGKGEARPTPDDVALVNYEGKLLDGTTFDKSQQPTPMPVKGVVPGFSEAMTLMPRGAKYRFWLKPSLAYGDKDQKDPTGKVVIPANSTLVFDVEMLDWKSEAEIRQMQAMQQMMQQRGAAPGAGAPPAGQ